MRTKEAKELILKHFEPQLNELGFKQKKRSGSTSDFYKWTTKNSYYNFGVDIYPYYPTVVFGFVCWQRIAVIESIFAEMNKQYNLFNSYDKYSPTLSLSIDDISLKNTSMETEEEVLTGFGRIVDCFLNVQMPTMELFNNDIREIDKLINGEGDNFWEYNHPRKPFELRDFYARRLIIGRLSKTNEAFESLVEKVYALSAKRRIDRGEPPLDRSDMSNPINFIVKYLRENIKSLY